jgi:hypothetical protein
MEDVLDAALLCPLKLGNSPVFSPVLFKPDEIYILRKNLIKEEAYLSLYNYRRDKVIKVQVTLWSL